MCQCISTISKYLLYFVNIVTFIIGFAFIVVGSLIISDRSFVSKLLSNQTEELDVEARIVTEDEIKSELDILFSYAGGIVVAVGTFVIILSVIGFVGLIKNSRCLLILYVFVITILTIAQTVAIVLAAIYQDILSKHLTEFLNSTLLHYGDDRDIRGKWNWKMSKLDCCGVTGWNDFEYLNFTSNAKKDALRLCCNSKQSNVKCQDLSFDDLNSDNTKPGCSLTAFQAFKDHYYADIAAVTFLIIANGLAIAAALGMTNDEEDKEEEYDGHFDDKYRPERSRKDSTMNNLQSLSQMRNPGIPMSRDSCFE